MALPAKKFYTPEEYLALEETAEYKSEYCNGEIFAMAGGSTNHHRIVVNVSAALHAAFRDTPCEVFASDVRLLTPSGLYTYPDVMVVCGKIEFAEGRNDTITNPVLIVEVWSESTKAYDRGDKFDLYRALTTLRDYVMIDQKTAHIEYFRRLEDRIWLLTDYRQMEGILKLDSIAVEIPMAEIYSKVDWTSA